MTTETKARLVLLTSSLLVSLLLVEGIVRVIEPREVLREFFETADADVHHRFVPQARGRQKTMEFDAGYEINSFGLRSPEIALTKPPGVKRLLVLGDSFTEGIGVQGHETFPSLLQATLDRTQSPGRWQVINGGVASYSPLLEYLFLKTRGLALDPDAVILALDLSDVFDDIQYAALARFDSQGNPMAVAPPAEPAPSLARQVFVSVKDVLKRHTRTYNFVRRRVAMRMLAAPDMSGDITLDKYASLRGDPASLDDESWSRTYEHLRRIRDLLHERNIPFWIAIYPYGLQISPREWSTGRLYWGFEADRVYTSRPQELLEAFGRGNGIPVINMVPDFQEASRRTFPLYFAFDGHWQPAGHQVAAASLHKALASQWAELEGRDDRRAGEASPQAGLVR